MRTLAAGALLISGSLLCAGQAGGEPYTFFKESIGLQRDEIAAIESGKPVTKVVSSKTPSLDSVAIKQLYASHYFQTALDLPVCAKDSNQPDDKGFYLITVKGSRQAGLTRPNGAIVRKNAISKIESSLETSLTRIKGVLESKQ